MGFKGKQHLTSVGYKNRHKEKQPMTAVITTNSKIYRRYKKMYDKLNRKYTSDQESSVINVIMGRSTLSARISSHSNRQLALLDIDKLLSFSLGSIKLNDIHFKVMRLVLQNTLNETVQHSRLFLQADRLRFNQVIRQDIFQVEMQRRQRRRRLEQMELLGRRRNEQRQRFLQNDQDHLTTFQRITRPTFQPRQRNIFNRRENNDILNMFRNPLVDRREPPRATGIVGNIFANTNNTTGITRNILLNPQQNQLPPAINILQNNIDDRQEITGQQGMNNVGNNLPNVERTERTGHRNIFTEAIRNFRNEGYIILLPRHGAEELPIGERVNQETVNQPQENTLETRRIAINRDIANPDQVISLTQQRRGQDQPLMTVGNRAQLQVVTDLANTNIASRVEFDSNNAQQDDQQQERIIF